MYDLIFLHAPSVYDFRERATLWGPISDLVPSTPVFDMYPLGFATLMAHLQHAGFKVRIVNLAARTVRSPHFSPDRAIKRGRPQLGTLGSGNHFLEVQEVSDVYDGNVIFGQDLLDIPLGEIQVPTIR